MYSRSQRQSNSLKISALSVSSIHRLEKKMNNDHLMLSNNLKSNKINVNLSVLIDINVIDYAFIDDSFAQRHFLLCFFCLKSVFFRDLMINQSYSIQSLIMLLSNFEFQARSSKKLSSMSLNFRNSQLF